MIGILGQALLLGHRRRHGARPPAEHRRADRLLLVPQPFLPTHPAARPAVQLAPAGSLVGDPTARTPRDATERRRGRRRDRTAHHRGAYHLRARELRLRPGDVRCCEDVNLEIAPGESVAFVGPTGAGKSTLAKLANRFYDPTAGRVLLDGVDVRTVTLRSLRSQLGVVPQEPFLFAGSIRTNLRFGRTSITDDEIDEAVDVVGLGDLVERLPHGLDTVVHERGQTLSVGRAPTARPGARVPRAPARADPRRGDVVARPAQRDDRSNAPSTDSSRVVRRSSSRTDSRRPSAPTASWSSTSGGIVEVGTPARAPRRGAPTPRCTTAWLASGGRDATR